MLPHLVHATDLVRDDYHCIHILSHLLHQLCLFLKTAPKSCCSHRLWFLKVFHLLNFTSSDHWYMAICSLCHTSCNCHSLIIVQLQKELFLLLKKIIILAWNISLDRQMEKIPAQPDFMYQSVSTVGINQKMLQAHLELY